MSRFLPHCIRRCFGIGFPYNYNEIVPGVSREEFLARIYIVPVAISMPPPSAPRMPSTPEKIYENPMCMCDGQLAEQYAGVYEECTICFDPITVDNEEVLMCKHKFCKKCIAKWTCQKMDATCPLCRHAIDTPVNHPCAVGYY